MVISAMPVLMAGLVGFLRVGVGVIVGMDQMTGGGLAGLGEGAVPVPEGMTLLTRGRRWRRRG